MTQRERERDPGGKAAESRPTDLTRKRTRQYSPGIHPQHTFGNTKLLLACFSSRREEGETILSVTWVRTVRCISYTMEHSALQLLTRLPSVVKGTVSLYPEFM